MGSKFTTVDAKEHDRIDERLEDVKRAASGTWGSLEDEIDGLLSSMYPPEAEDLGKLAARLEVAAKKLRALQSELDPKLTEKQAQVLRVLKRDSGATFAELADKVASSPSGVGTVAKALQRNELARVEGGNTHV